MGLLRRGHALIRGLALLSYSLTLPPSPVAGCTTIAVGRLASSDGSVLCSHSNDGEGTTDPRLVRVPPSVWPAGSRRKVFYSPESFPRYVGPDRASTSVVDAYEPRSGYGEGAFEPICEIEQVERTYGYFEETYGAMNERQLGIAESTCSGVFGAAPRGMHYPGYGVGKACLSVDALTQIAMERHHRARDAILEMGRLAVRYGFYGAGLFEGTAESLIVTDAEEAWVFHVLPDPTGASAIWAARRVPDDSFAVVPNAFIIRDIDRDDADDFMYSDSVHGVAADLGWWSESDGTPLDFTAVYSDGEYANKYYSGRRSWGVYRLFAPSLDLSAEYEEWRISRPFPFAAGPDRKISVEDVADAMRYFYQGTEYAQAGEGSGSGPGPGPGELPRLAGGPWGSPDHVAGGNSTAMPRGLNRYGVPGNWERTIGLYRTSDSYIVQSRGWLPDSSGGVLWYGAYAAPYAVYTPFAAGMGLLPNATLGHHMTLDKGTLFWSSRYLGNYVQLKWESMMREVVAFQREAMRENLELQARVDALASGGQVRGGAGADDDDDDDGDVPEDPLDLYSRNAVDTVAKIWDLCDHLMFSYADGQYHATEDSVGTSSAPRRYDRNGATTEEADVVDQPGYPGEWLDLVGYPDGPPPPPDCADLDWRCGHRPSGGGGGGPQADTGTVTGEAWREYYRLRESARAAGAACAERGDAAAAGAGRCANGGAGRSEIAAGVA